jgi:hypothetical protein
VSRSARVALAAICLAVWSQTAVAACVDVPGGTELTIEQLGRVIFTQLTTDRAGDQVTFGGGVCLELGGLEVNVSADTMVVRAPGAYATVEAQGAVVEVEGWLLRARRLELDPSTARLEDVTLEGSGIVGHARSMELDLERGGMTATGLEVLTPIVRLVAAVGTFSANDLLVVEEVVASTCDCPPQTAGIRIEGRRAQLALAEATLVIEGGVLVVEGLRLALPAMLQLTEESLGAIRVPVSVGVIAEGERGWVVGLLERRDGPAAVTGDIAFGPNADPRWSAGLIATEEGSSIAVQARDGALAIAAAHRIELAPDWELVLAHRNEGGAVKRRLQDSSLTVGWDRAWPPAPGRAWRFDARGTLAAGLSAQHRDGADAAHGRGALAGSVSATSPATPAGQLSVRVESGVTGYTGIRDRQAWFGAAPRWRWSSGPLSVDLQHTWRGVDGTSPFDARIDLVAPASLTILRASLAGGTAWRATAAIDVRHDWRSAPERPSGRVGLERLRVSAGLTTPPLGDLGLVWTAAALLEAAGALDPRADRDAFVRASIGVVSAARATEIALSSEVGIGPLRPGVRSLTIAGAAPLTFAGGDVVLQPYLALDVWPWFAGTGSGRIVGHGLALDWNTCCGALAVAYRSLPDGSVTTRLGFAIDTRVPDLDDLR